MKINRKALCVVVGGFVLISGFRNRNNSTGESNRIKITFTTRYANETTCTTNDYTVDTSLSTTVSTYNTDVTTSILENNNNIENNNGYEKCITLLDCDVYSEPSKNAFKSGTILGNEVVYKLFSYNDSWDLITYNNNICYINKDNIKYLGEFEEDIYEHKKCNDIVLTTTDLNFRTLPSVESTKISTFKENTELTVLAKTLNNWLLVRHNNKIGYVHSNYTYSLLDEININYPWLGIYELNTSDVVYSITNLNIRCGNGVGYDKIGVLDPYESVRVIEKYDDWYFVMTNEYQFGFVHKDYVNKIDNRYVIVDISEQSLYVYNNTSLWYKTPVTTGKDSTPSDIGLFEIYSKEKDTYLVGSDYKTFVNYWMPYNGGEGLHDATWHNNFGTDLYKQYGSHGCINMPLSITGEIYDNLEVGSKVLVHK